jgi:hypothetical protein
MNLNDLGKNIWTAFLLYTENEFEELCLCFLSIKYTNILNQQDLLSASKQN